MPQKLVFIVIIGFSGVGTVQEECSQDLAGPGPGDVTPHIHLSINLDAFSKIYFL